MGVFRRAGKYVLPLGAVLLLTAQLPQTGKPREVDPTHRSVWDDTNVTPEVKAILRRSCADCHSDQTRLPWYGHVAPASWLISRDIDRGRQKLDLSNWPIHSQNEAEEIGDAVASKNMPPWDYLLLHKQARLSPTELQAIDSWVSNQNSSSSKR